MSLPTIDVVVCVHNALEDVENCLASVERSSYPAEALRLIVVDDGSDGPTADFVRYTADRLDWVTRIRHETGNGYTVAANAGVASGDGELVVLLNSDTIVPAGWLQKIVEVFAAKPDVGLVGPLSNAASWQSVPDIAAPEGGWAANQLPNGYDVDDMDAVVGQAAQTLPVIPRLPLLNGFCMAVRRAVFNDIGGFDEEHFPLGFGEEDDFCMRASLAGYGLGLAADLYVYHSKSKSYGSERRNELTKAGQAALAAKHSEARLQRASDTMKHNPYLAQMRSAVRVVLENEAG